MQLVIKQFIADKKNKENASKGLYPKIPEGQNSA